MDADGHGLERRIKIKSEIKIRSECEGGMGRRAGGVR
jgi:hypothetical protein